MAPRTSMERRQAMRRALLALASLQGVCFSLLPKTALHAQLVGDDGTTFERFERSSPMPDKGERDSKAPKKSRVKETVDDTWYDGTVKGYNPEQGFGFIRCDELFSKYEADVFLHKKQVNEHLGGRSYSGNEVRFQVGLNKAGKPQARNVEQRIGGHWVDLSKVYVGTVKEYWPEKGFGFIACDETHFIFRGDVFLHKNEAEKNNLTQGKQVTFGVQVNSKNMPQARNVKLVFEEEGRAKEPVQMEEA